MKKHNQFLEFTPFYPLQSLQNTESTLNLKESSTLLEIWSGSRDEYGNIIVPSNTDPLVVSSLLSKGMIKKKSGVFLNNRIELTKRGQVIVRNIVLGNEKSTFEKHRTIHAAVNKIVKVASVNTNRQGSWFNLALKSCT